MNQPQLSGPTAASGGSQDSRFQTSDLYLLVIAVVMATSSFYSFLSVNHNSGNRGYQVW